jgi:hypothetical protein
VPFPLEELSWNQQTANRVGRRDRKEARVGQANHGWCKLGKHANKKALTWFDAQQVDALIRDSWGDVGHLTVFVRRDDAADDRRWSATVFDHENQPLLTAHAPTKQTADGRAVEALKALGHSTTGYGSKAGKPIRVEN